MTRHRDSLELALPVHAPSNNDLMFWPDDLHCERLCRMMASAMVVAQTTTNS